ncbi:hypothetical protein JCM11641_002061 [Rhodosporidiobolus odoratus]
MDSFRTAAGGYSAFNLDAPLPGAMGQASHSRNQSPFLPSFTFFSAQPVSPFHPAAEEPPPYPHLVGDEQKAVTAATPLFDPTTRPFLHHRSSSTYSLASSLDENKDSGPLFSPQALHTGLGAHRRTPAIRNARETSQPYSRRSSLPDVEQLDTAALTSTTALGFEDRLAGMFGSSPSTRSLPDDGGAAPSPDPRELSHHGINTRTFPFTWGHSTQQVLPPAAFDSPPAGPSQIASDSLSDADSQEFLLTQEEWEKVNATEQALTEAADEYLQASTATATDKARAAFVQTWLGESYRIEEGSTVARQALYASFVKTAQRYDVKSLNSASFGKALRQAFPTLKTRRLGTRGHSRYCLVNFVPTNPVEAAQLARCDEECKAGSGGELSASEWSGTDEDAAAPHVEPLGETTFSRRANLNSLSISIPTGGLPFDEQKTLLGAASTAVPGGLVVPRLPQALSPSKPPLPPPAPQSVHPLPAAFPPIEEVLQGTSGMNQEESLRALWHDFSVYSGALLWMVREEDFCAILLKLYEWWSTRSASDIALLQHSSVVGLHVLLDLHTKLGMALAPDTLSALQTLADTVESNQAASLRAFTANALILPLVELSARLAHLLSLHLALRKLVDALRGILFQPGVSREMAQGWLGVNFPLLKKHASFTLNINLDLLNSALQDFGSLLLSPHGFTVAAFLAWLEARWQEHGQNATSLRMLLLTVSWVSEQIMRDLTLRSSPAFGAFQIVHLLMQ